MTETEFKQCYNKNVLALTSDTMDYIDFNTALLDAGKATTVTIKDRCHGWYAFSQDELMVVLKEKNRIVHTLARSQHPGLCQRVT